MKKINLTLSLLLLLMLCLTAVCASADDIFNNLGRWSGQKLKSGNWRLMEDATLTEDWIIEGTSDSEFGPDVCRITLDLNGHMLDLGTSNILVRGGDLTIIDMTSTDSNPGQINDNHIRTSASPNGAHISVTDGSGFHGKLTMKSVGVGFRNQGGSLIKVGAGCEAVLDHFIISNRYSEYNLSSAIHVDGGKLTLSNSNWNGYFGSGNRSFLLTGSNTDVSFINSKLFGLIEGDTSGNLTFTNCNWTIHPIKATDAVEVGMTLPGHVIMSSTLFECENTVGLTIPTELRMNSGTLMEIKGPITFGLGSKLYMSGPGFKAPSLYITGPSQFREAVLHGHSFVQCRGPVQMSADLQLNEDAVFTIDTGENCQLLNRIVLNDDSRLNVRNSRSVATMEIVLNDTSRAYLMQTYLYSKVTAQARLEYCVTLNDDSKLDIGSAILGVSDVRLNGNSNINAWGNDAYLESMNVYVSDHASITAEKPDAVIRMQPMTPVAYDKQTLQVSGGRIENKGGTAVFIAYESGVMHQIVLSDSGRIEGSTAIELAYATDAEVIFDQTKSDQGGILAGSSKLFEASLADLALRIRKKSDSAQALMLGSDEEHLRLTGIIPEQQMMKQECVYPYQQAGLQSDDHFLSATEGRYIRISAPKDIHAWMNTRNESGLTEGWAAKDSPIEVIYEDPTGTSTIDRVFVEWQDENKNVVSSEKSFEIVPDGHHTYFAVLSDYYYMALDTNGIDSDAQVWITSENGEQSLIGKYADLGATKGTTLTAHTENIDTSPWDFVGWSDPEGTILSDQRDFGIGMYENSKLTAVYRGQPTEIRLQAMEGGTVLGAGTYDYGDFAQLIAVPDEGYIFSVWMNEYNEILSTERIYEHPVTKDETVTAYFQHIQMKLELDADGAEVSDAIPGFRKTQYVDYGTPLEITAVDEPDTDTFFLRWVNNATGEQITERTLTLIPRTPLSFTAYYGRKVVVDVTLSGPAYSAIVFGGGKYRPGETVVVSFLPALGTETNFKGWLRDGAFYSGDMEISFTADADTSLTAVVESVNVHHCRDYVCLICGHDFRQEILESKTLYLPKKLLAVHEGAFADVSANYIVIPGSIQEYHKDVVDPDGPIVIFNQ